MAASSWRRTRLYARERQSFSFICYSHQEDNGRNSKTLANGKFESHEVSNGPWSKVYCRSHFLTILFLAISSRWTWNSLWSGNLPATKPPKITSLSESTITLSNRKFIPVLKALWLVHFCKRQQRCPRHLPLKNSRKKTLEKNKIDNQKDIRNFFSAKGKPDLHLEETTVIEIVNSRITLSLVLCQYLCFLIPIWKVTAKYLFSGNSLYQGVPYFFVQIWYKCQFFFFLLLLCQTVCDF